MTRRILLVAHPRRSEAQHLAKDVVARLVAEGIEVALLPEEAEAVNVQTDNSVLEADPDDPARDCELVCVLGGDGTILRGAEMSRGTDAPLLGVNLGHVGFLAEAEREDLKATVERIVNRDYTVEERMTLDVRVACDGEVVARSWALNEVSVEKAARERMLELALEIDGRPLSTFGCDGIADGHPHRVDRLRLLRRGPGRVARRRGHAGRPHLRPRPVLPAAGHRPEVPAGGRGPSPERGGGRHVVRRRPDGRAAPRRADRRVPQPDARSGWPGWRPPPSPTGWWPSSTSRSRAGAARPGATATPGGTWTAPPSSAWAGSAAARTGSSARPRPADRPGP